MKKLIAIVALFVSVTALAQNGDRQERGKKMMDATPEEIADIQTKRMTLALVLDEKQQKEVYNIELANAKERKAMRASRESKKNGEKPTESQREAMKKERKANYSAMLDKQIAQQEKMKNILNEEQFDQYRKMKAKRHDRMANRDGRRGNKSKDRKGSEGDRR
ncbi:DUF4890 domain-containing protein [Leeuwenhoekiella sp. LLG6367-2.1]|uniref:DUF4890 domain-containing protein n=1 Tax=Leeuwenhoekiella sp. LLG6367-2.1 TaxID=3160833 RepID=UPI00386BE9EC